jgi:uncharacterized protein YaaR (DUF327 family)
MNEIQFGFLPYKINIDNELFQIKTLENIDELFLNLKEQLHIHNKQYIYYPTFNEQVNMPMSHILKLKESEIYDEYLLYYLIHIIGFHSNQWIMPKNYWFDGSINFGPTFKNELPKNYFDNNSLEEIIKQGINTFQNNRSNCKYKNNIVAALYSYNSFQKYRWEFEWFFELYKTFDSLWQYTTCCLKNKELIKKHSNLKNEIESKHERRLKAVYDFLEISDYKLKFEVLERAYKLRNELVHEAKWDGEILGHKLSSKETFMTVIQFKGFVRRFLKFAITNDKNYNFLESNVWEIQ